VEKDKIFSCANIEVLEFLPFPVILCLCIVTTLQSLYLVESNMSLHVFLQWLSKCMVLWMRITNCWVSMTQIKTLWKEFFFSPEASSRLVFYKCTCYSFFEEHLFNHIWWSEVDFDIKFHHNNSCSKQRISSTSWTSQGLDH
jgi:hypothetical protein